MQKPIRFFAILSIVLLLGACNFPLNAKTTLSSTAAATSTSGSIPVQATDTVPAATTAFSGSPPGEPPNSVASWLTDTKTPVNPKNAYAVDGDNYANNQFERPFDKELAYRPDLDIHSATLTLDSQWFYVTIQLDGIQPDKNALIACYGVELDVNLDGRGEFVVWAQPPFTASWSREDLTVYGTSTNMVGGTHPLLSDAPWKGETYDKIIFDGKASPDVNAAWVRVSPKDSKSLQIAFSPDIIQKPTRFLWNAWADDGIKDPTRFDYNDVFTKKEAGSPYKWDPDYPPKTVWAVDNTCRAPYGFKPTGNLPGQCELQATPGPTTKGPTATRTLLPPPG
jgi:hypothetical protein